MTNYFLFLMELMLKIQQLKLICFRIEFFFLSVLI